MIEKLITARKEKLAEYEKLKKVLETEKRTAFNADERTKANELKIALAELKEQIEIEESMDTEKRSYADSKIDVNVPLKTTDNASVLKATETEFRNFLTGKKVNNSFIHEGKFQLGVDYLTEKRAVITTSSNPAFEKTTTLDAISVQSPDLVLQRAGAQRLFFDANHGNVKAPSMASLRGVFVAEGGTASEFALTSASALLEPTFLVVPLKVSKQFIASQSAANFNDLIAKMLIGIEHGLEYKGYQELSGITALSLVSGSSLYNAVLAQEAGVIGTGSAYIFSKTGVQLAKQSKVGTDQTMVWKDNTVNGYPAYRSSILSDVRPSDAFYGRFSDVALATFGPISVEMVTDATLSLAGEIMIIVSTMADAKVINSASFARITGVNGLNLK